MSNPTIVLRTGYATEQEARAVWSNIVDNDKVEIVQVIIDAFNLANKPRVNDPVCYLLLPTSESDTE